MKTFRFVIKQITPLLFSYFFVGIAFGILINDVGYSALWACLAGIFIYAGSMQIVMVSLMSAGVPLHMVAIMTFFINARHIFYGIGFVDRFRKMGWKYPYMVLTLTDETYSVLCSIKYPDNMDEQKVDFYIALTCHLLWIFSCTAGALIGQMITVDMTGIEFSATAFFVVVCVNQWRQFNSHIPAVAGLASAVVFYMLLGADSFLLPALSVSMIVLIIMKDTINQQMGGMKYNH
ncbi:AzlC family ABC transporter permease [Desulfotomaculum sp. 1211_IL3151]|uniref:AzlC family ABC transporter permease n=1 Tax=Desulfotomaculum sp. 1211_IL3151 TaxID=3084055 RepID=UPI002FDB877A